VEIHNIKGNEMSLKFCLRLICLGLFLSFGAINNSHAQNTSFEFWPEADIWYRLNPSWRLSAFIPITKYYESKERDVNIYLQADYAWGKTKHVIIRKMMDDNKAQQIKGFMARGGFMEGWSLADHGESYREDMLFAEIHRRIPLRGNILLSNRLRSDFRWLGKDSAEFSYRIRFRIMLEKEFELKRSSIIPYINAEPYFDSRYSTFNRVRLIGGTTVSWGPRLALESNFTYQLDSKSSVTHVYATNIIVHWFFEKKHSKNSN
jgi:Protein of unknown function (DUF2490)